MVATSPLELQRLQALQENAAANAIQCRMVERDQLKEMEPSISGLKALFVEQSGIVDYQAISTTMGALIEQGGGTIKLGMRVTSLEERADCVRIHTDQGILESRYAIACAGLQADRLARQSGLSVDFQIIPFRGEYYALRPQLNRLVERMIYPVPDPAMPFLGIHLTPMIDGSLTVGPNAVLGLSVKAMANFPPACGILPPILDFRASGR